MPSSPVVYTCDEHSAVYYHLAAEGARQLAVTHLDAHCDLRGTLIDRALGKAWLRRPAPPVSGSTYLSHMVAEGIAVDISWVHDEVGGRENDLRTVLYTSDLERLAYRLVRRPRGAGVDLAYRELDYAAWRHRDGERVLDIDWDFFADWRKSALRSAREIEQLLDEKLEVAPHRVYVAYSPQYSRPGRDDFEAFVKRLARRLAGKVQALPEAPLPPAGGLVRALPPAWRRRLRVGLVRIKRAYLR